jgi:hypothetical protein
MTLDELKTILVLNGNQRIPYAEVEIFENPKLTNIYLHSISSEYKWYFGINYCSDVPWTAYRYAKNVIKGRWIEAEPLIKADMMSGVFYDGDILGVDIDL